MANQGMGVDDVRTIYREEYLYWIEQTRARHDPCDDWEAFREELWKALVPAFGLDVEVETSDDEGSST